jgi:hypothetical protein
LNIKKPDRLNVGRQDMFLGGSAARHRIFVLRRRSADELCPSLETLDPNSFAGIESIPLNSGDRKIGAFFGSESGNATLIKGRYTILLFNGESRLGVFASGYVVIVDAETKNVKYIAVGSNPASGIAY